MQGKSKWACGFAALALAASAWAQEATPQFEGSWASEKLKITIQVKPDQPVAGRYFGTMELAGESYPFQSVAIRAGALVSRFKTPSGEQYPFEARLSGTDAMQITSGASKWDLKRVGAAPAPIPAPVPTVNPLPSNDSPLGALQPPNPTPTPSPAPSPNPVPPPPAPPPIPSPTPPPPPVPQPTPTPVPPPPPTPPIPHPEPPPAPPPVPQPPPPNPQPIPVPTQPSPQPPPPPPPPSTNPTPPAPAPSGLPPANPLGDLPPAPPPANPLGNAPAPTVPPANPLGNTPAPAPANPLGSLPTAAPSPNASPANPLGDLPPAANTSTPPANPLGNQPSTPPAAPANPLGDLPGAPPAATPAAAFQSTPALDAAIEKAGDLIFQSKDYAGAWKALDPALRAGHPEAYYYAGMMNHFGWGVPKDAAKAVDFYSRGAAAGSWYCVNNLGICMRDGIGLPQNFPEARKCFQSAALHGNAEAGWNMGAMVLNGQGAAADRVEGCAWLSASNHPEALKQLPALTEQLNDAQRQQVRQRADQLKAQIAANRPIAIVRITLADKPDGSIVVASVVPGSAAANAGIRVGDVLLGINNQPIKGMNAAAAMQLLDGPIGSNIQLHLKQADGGNLQAAFPREKK